MQPVEVAVFGAGVLRDHREATVILQLLADLPGLGPNVYDENAQQRWRPFDLHRLPQDVVVQRTHFVHVACADGVALLDTGRRSGQWQLRVRCPSGLAVDEQWWRAALQGAGAASLEVSRGGEVASRVLLTD